MNKRILSKTTHTVDNVPLITRPASCGCRTVQVVPFERMMKCQFCGEKFEIFTETEICACGRHIPCRHCK